ncbi:MAG: pantoate--beta-alanine ligase [Candidatus Omnitrophota bacterium]
MRVIRTVNEMRKALLVFRQKNLSIGFVPTMGYFHQGHLSLMQASVEHHDVTVVSLFVNPFQFGPKEDLLCYPRDIKHDIKSAREAGVDFLFIPSSREMYLDPFLTFVDVGEITQVLCGASRPGHFRGVATVVAKLLNIVRPQFMYMGQKDAQQVEVVTRMVKDLNFDVKVCVRPTCREADGLAMSSRNARLSPSERSIAPRLYQALCVARQMADDGERNAVKIISQIKKLISDGTGASIDYVSCIGLDRFMPVRRIKGKVLVAVAVRIGKTRLIDNIVIKAQ